MKDVQSRDRGSFVFISCGEMQAGCGNSRDQKNYFFAWTGDSLAAGPTLWQVKCQLFTGRGLRNFAGLPSIQRESRPAALVMVVTDF
jgi:hypothetical protein